MQSPPLGGSSDILHVQWGCPVVGLTSGVRPLWWCDEENKIALDSSP